MGSAPERLSVCIVTYERPEFLRRCLVSLQEDLFDDVNVVVVDASKNSKRDVVAALRPTAMYVHAPELAGWMTRSRNEALRWATGTVISFLDDDVVVRPGWQAAVLDAFGDASVSAVAGRTCNGQPGEDHYAAPIGRLRPDGTLSEGFASLPGGPVEVDHGIGANMSFRRSVLAELGGFRDDYPGTAIREDTDIFLRVRALGGRIVFVPGAVVDHRPAPHVRGARFDTRYKLYARRNHLVLLARFGGFSSPMLRRWAARQLGDITTARGLTNRLRRVAVTVCGLVWGLAAALGLAGWAPTPPARQDAKGRELRRLLS